MSSLVEKLFDRTVPALQRTMDLTYKRNQAIASNIANAETPQYRAIDIDFAGELKKAFKMDSAGDELAKTNPGHMDLSGSSQAHFVSDYSGVTRSDGNNVDLDIQMGKMVRNSGKYSLSASLVRKKLQMLRIAIRQAIR